MINDFKGKYYFLSNFYNAPVRWGGITYQNNEAAFQSAKVLDKSAREKFSTLDPSSAKRKGRQVHLRQDWEKVKYDIMYEICFAKFSQNEELKTKLLATGDEHLEEGNTWGDRIWGTVNGEGQNNLGKILMRIREELKAEQYYELCRSYFLKCDLENLNTPKNKELIELALENIDKAVELNSSCADYYDTRSLILSLAGYDNEALRNAFIASTLRNP